MQNTPYGNEDMGLGDTGGELPLVDGTPVYDPTGSKVGTVSQHHPDQSYFVMSKGFFFPKDLYVPLSAIQRATTDGVYLNLAKDQIKNENWDQPPSQGSVPTTRTAPPEGRADQDAMPHQGEIQDRFDAAGYETEGRDISPENQRWNQPEPPAPAPQP